MVLLGACSDLGYYGQAVRGHLALMIDQRPLDAVIADPDTGVQRRQRLRASQDMLDFAHQQLQLPDNGSYRSYVDLDRPYVVWSVFAAPELSLKPTQWCFPIAGCVVYRGYFDEAAANRYAQQLQRAGADTHVGGATAYSTLGWFADPLLSSFLRESDWQTAALLFHELAHQRLYIPDDSSFVESFAVAVEREGLRRWLQQRGDQPLLDRVNRYWLHRDQRRASMTAVRSRLQQVYDSGLSDARKRAFKARILGALHQQLKGPADGNHDTITVNNATLAAAQAYDELLPAFQALLEQHEHDLPAFYAAVEAISELPKAERRTALQDRHYAVKQPLAASR